MADLIKVKVRSEALAKALGVTAGKVVEVKTRQGVPVSREWRNRLRDSKFDNCVSVVEPKKAKQEGK